MQRKPSLSLSLRHVTTLLMALPVALWQVPWYPSCTNRQPRTACQSRTSLCQRCGHQPPTARSLEPSCSPLHFRCKRRDRLHGSRCAMTLQETATAPAQAHCARTHTRSPACYRYGTASHRGPAIVAGNLLRARLESVTFFVVLGNVHAAAAGGAVWRNRRRKERVVVVPAV